MQKVQISMKSETMSNKVISRQSEVFLFLVSLDVCFIYPRLTQGMWLAMTVMFETSVSDAKRSNGGHAKESSVSS